MSLTGGPLSVLIVTDYYPPFIGGGQRASRELALQLAERGHDVAVATVWQPGTLRREHDAPIDVFRIRQLRTLVRRFAHEGQHHHPPFPDPVSVLELRRIIRRQQPTVIYAYGWISYSVWVANLGLGVPVVLGAHDYGYSCATRILLRNDSACAGPTLAHCIPCAARHYGAPKGFATVAGVLGGRRFLRRRAAAVHSISTYVGDVMRRDFLSGRATPGVVEETIPSFSRESDDEGTAAAIDASVSRLPERQFMLFVGALRHTKGLDILLEAYRGLPDRPPLVLIGTRSPDTPDAFPEGVTVLTDVPHGAVIRAWRRCLFGIAPSVWPEPLGLVVHEAMGQGKAIIGTTPGGHRDLIEDGVSGLLVPAGDVEALRAAMRRLVEDPALCARLGDAALERAAEASPATLVPRYEHLLRRVSSGGRRADVSDPVPTAHSS